jgi:nucleoside phosphorylase
MTVHPFVTGGPVPPDSPVYIERAADDRMRKHLLRMEYVTLVEPRQQGKTSLIHRLTHKLEPGYILTYTSAMRLDKINEADWYASLCSELLSKIPFISDGDCPSFPHNGSTWGNFMAELAELAEATGHNLIIALDELGDVWVDWRLGFFSNIRVIFDERPNKPHFKRLTFILAGTYNPRALIDDSRTSPFNVAQRVQLPDFTLSQTSYLVGHLELPADNAVAVAQRVHYWTDGQPYLTQRLCRTLAEDEVSATPEKVDLAVDRLYREDTNHLPRILEALDLKKYPRLSKYVQRVLSGHRPQFRPASEGRYHSSLALIGVLKADEDGRCKVRNRIYEQMLNQPHTLGSREPVHRIAEQEQSDCAQQPSRDGGPTMDRVEDLKGKVHFGIITVRPDEYSEVLAQLSDKLIIDGSERRYRVASLSCSDGSEVVVAVTRCIEQGNIEAQKTASGLVQDLDPQWVLVVGIAGGVPDSDFSLGDVVISSRVYDLTLEAAKPEGEREYSIKGGTLHQLARRVVQDIPGMLVSEVADWHSRVEMERPMLALEELDKCLKGGDKWKNKVKKSLIKHFSESRSPIALPGAIASSDRLVKDPEITADWKRVARHFLAIDMELAGVCRALEKLPVLGIRGISDIVGLERDEIWTTYACKTAAAFAISLISSGLMPLKQSVFYEQPTEPILQDTPKMNLSIVRHKLDQMFDDPELDAFCLENFPNVYDKFSRGMRRDEKVTLLLEYCRRKSSEYERLAHLLVGEVLFIS